MVKEKIKNICNITDIEVYNSFDIKNLNLSSLDLLIVLGGDGTLLGVARELDDDFKAPILGIYIGNLGVLSSIEISDLELALKKLMTKDCKVHKRMMLNCEVDINESIKNIKALNEVAVARGTLSRIVPFLDNGAAVTTSRNDVHYVATEYGVAELRGKSLKDRARELIYIAHPNFRDDLIEEWEKRFNSKFDNLKYYKAYN